MAEERKDSFAETVDTAASAAHTVKGAIKAGKAISGAAKGAAAGGPYGAVAGAVWAGRKHIGKIVAVIVILLLLPVLFVLMLPGLIFGGLINAFSPADTEQPVLNSETAIVSRRSPPGMRLTWNCPARSGAPTSSLPATRTAPLIFWQACSCPFALLSWCGMQTRTARAASCRFPSISWGKSSLPAEPFRTSPAVSV